MSTNPTTQRDLEALVPGLAKARRAEQAARLRALLGRAGTSRLLGREVVALTPRIALELRLAGNPCVEGMVGTWADMALFLWRLSPRFCRPAAWLRWRTVGRWERRRIRRAVRRLKHFQASASIRAWVIQQLQDAPPRVTTTEEAGAATPPSGFTAEASIINWFADHYGWDADRALDTPFLLLWQCYRAFYASAGRPVPSMPPSERLVGAWFVSMQARTGAAGAGEGAP